MSGACLEHAEESLEAAPSRSLFLLSVSCKAAPLHVVFKATPPCEISLCFVNTLPPSFMMNLNPCRNCHCLQLMSKNH